MLETDANPERDADHAGADAVSSATATLVEYVVFGMVPSSRKGDCRARPRSQPPHRAIIYGPTIAPRHSLDGHPVADGFDSPVRA